MAGHALPLVILVEPGIGEASVVFEGLAFVGSLGVVCPHHDRRIDIRNNSHFIIGNQAGAIVRVFQVFRKSALFITVPS